MATSTYSYQFNYKVKSVVRYNYESTNALQLPLNLINASIIQSFTTSI